MGQDGRGGRAASYAFLVLSVALWELTTEGARAMHSALPPTAYRLRPPGGLEVSGIFYGSCTPTLILPFFPGLPIPPGDTIHPVAGYRFSHQSLRFFGGLHDADIDEILGTDTVVVCRYRAQTRARLKPVAIELTHSIFPELGQGGRQTARGEGENLGRNGKDTQERSAAPASR